MLVNAIETEVAKGRIKPVENAGELVDLLLEALHGVGISPKSHKKNMFPVKENLEEIHKKRLLLCGIFIKGLKF
jgi:TetR/AcrR family transcriptional repressor of mexJK operon